MSRTWLRLEAARESRRGWSNKCGIVLGQRGEWPEQRVWRGEMRNKAG